MTHSAGDPAPEADVAEQQIPVDAAAEPTLDVDYVQERSGADANPADVMEQAIDVPTSDEDRG